MAVKYPGSGLQYRLWILSLVFDLGCSFLLRRDELLAAYLDCSRRLPVLSHFSVLHFCFVSFVLLLFCTRENRITPRYLRNLRPYRIRRTYMYALARPSLLSSTHRFTTRIAVCSQSLRAILPRALPCLSLLFQRPRKQKRTARRHHNPARPKSIAAAEARPGSRPWMGVWRLSFFGEPASPAFFCLACWDRLLWRRSFWTCACIRPSRGIA